MDKRVNSKFNRNTQHPYDKLIERICQQRVKPKYEPKLALMLLNTQLNILGWLFDENKENIRNAKISFGNSKRLIINDVGNALDEALEVLQKTGVESANLFKEKIKNKINALQIQVLEFEDKLQNMARQEKPEKTLTKFFSASKSYTPCGHKVEMVPEVISYLEQKKENSDQHKRKLTDFDEFKMPHAFLSDNEETNSSSNFSRALKLRREIVKANIQDIQIINDNHGQDNSAKQEEIRPRFM